MEWFVTFFGGGFLGLFLQRAVDLLLKPSLSIEIGDGSFWPNSSNQDIKFLHIKVENKKRNWLLQLLRGNPTAKYTTAWISFLDYDSEAEILKLVGRWSSLKEPVNYTTQTIDIGEVLVIPREIIPVDEETSLVIGIKINGQESCFGFNNHSYFYSQDKWRDPEFELNEKKYKVQVKISSEGNVWSKKFLLLNPGKLLKNFKLYDLSTEN